ncbi:hypothetical protein [Streptomyces sp. NPDC055506]
MAALDAWLVFEGEAGFSMTPPATRTWSRRGHTPVIRVRGRSRRRLSVAALACYKAGERSRLIYRPCPDTATLRDGVSYESGQRQWTVKPGSRVTVSGHAYTVRQICSYRVVLEPRDAKDKAALAAAPESMEFVGGAADNTLCFTTNHAVLAAASKSFPDKGQTLSLIANGGVKQLPTGPSLTVSYVDTAAGTAGLGANCAGVPVAVYKDVRVGETVEFAGVRFRGSALTEQAVRLTRTSE